MLDWNAYDAFFAALEGQSHQQIAHAAERKIAVLRRPAGREVMRRQIVIGRDERGNDITLMENTDGTWTNLYAEIIVPAELVERHYAHLLTQV